MQSGIESPETLVTLGAQDTRRRQTKQKTQLRKVKRWATRSSPPLFSPQKTRVFANGKQYLPLIRHPPCYSYRQGELDIYASKDN